MAPRGRTQWVRNLRASGEGRLLLGRRAERFTATELTDDEKPPLLRAYLERWKMETGVFFGASAPTPPPRTCAASPPTTRCSASPRRASVVSR